MEDLAARFCRWQSPDQLLGEVEQLGNQLSDKTFFGQAGLAFMRDLPLAAGITEGGPEGTAVGRDRVSVRARDAATAEDRPLANPGAGGRKASATMAEFSLVA